MDSLAGARGLGCCLPTALLSCTRETAHVQVDEGENVQGYRNYLAVPEWYKLRTPFFQWYTKNYASVCLPLAQQLECADGHVWGLDLLLARLTRCCTIFAVSSTFTWVTAGRPSPDLQGGSGEQGVTPCGRQYCPWHGADPGFGSADCHPDWRCCPAMPSCFYFVGAAHEA